jgi:heme o synthase
VKKKFSRTRDTIIATATIKTYYRLTKPGIIYGNVLTLIAGFLFASIFHFEAVDLGLLAATVFGTALVIACGCVINNFLDRGIDQKMARTEKRALATATLSSRPAIIYGVVLGVMGFAVLALYTNILTVAVGAVGLFFYLVMYSIGKRRSVYGTIIGSVSGATPILAGYTAATNQLDAAAWLLFLIMVCWQMPHFYAIAMYRLKDYRAAGLPVWPVARGNQETKIQIAAFILAFIATTLQLTARGYTSYVFMVIMVVVSAVWLQKALQGFKTADETKWAKQMFLFSLKVVLVLSIMLPLGVLLP